MRYCSKSFASAAILALAVFATPSMLVGPAHAADEASLRSAYIDGPWGQMNVREAGATGDPTVVLLHQMIWSADQFRSAQEELAKRGIRSIAIDVPGYGSSAGPSAPVPLPRYAEALVPILKHFGLQSANLLGVNESVTIVCAFAEAHPDMVKSLIIDGPMLLNGVDKARYFSMPRAYVLPRADGGHFQSAWRAEMDRVGKLSVAGLQSMLMGVYGAGDRGWYVQDAAYSYDLEPVLRRLKAPTLLLTYPNQQFRRAALHLKEIRPDITLTEIAADGVAPSFDQPELWAESVANYLKATR
jgi:pimeloyl-ACP methyl ester carboxylesterase